MKIIKFLFSGTFMGILLIIFAISMGYATFIENDFGTATAKLMVYNAKWFELVMVLMAVNFTGMIFTRQLYRKSKINILFMHVSFIIIIIGAGITRYIGYEGVMHIREGETTSEFLSDAPYVHYQLRSGGEVENALEDVLLAPINKTLYHEEHEINAKDVNIAVTRFMPNAREMVHPDESGVPYLNLIAAAHGSRMNMYIRENESKNLGGLRVSFEDTTSTDALQIKRVGEDFFLRAPEPVMHMNMSSGEIKNLEENQWHEAKKMNIYTIKGTNFVIREYIEKASLQYMPAEEENTGKNIVEVAFTVDGNTKTLTLTGGPRMVGRLEQSELDGVELDIRIGAQVLELPFSLKLNDFILDRYPGSMSPSSFASEITLIDPDENITMPYRIFMNNVLSYEGFRFYQSSYDEDERGTILSVNHDYWGTVVTYFGYFLLFATLIISLFTPKTRFAKLRQQLDEIHVERKKLAKIVSFLIIGILSINFSFAQDTSGNTGLIDRRHANEFGKTLVQSRDGRIVPVNTSATNILVKIYKKSGYKGVSANQVILGMLAFPEKWKNEPLIKVYDESVQEILGIESDYASFNQCFDESGHYKLREQVSEAYAKSPAKRNQLDKEIIYVDERLNVAFMAFNGSFLNIYPIPDHPEDKWVAPVDKLESVNATDSAFIRSSFHGYMNSLRNALNTGDYGTANQILSEIKEFQQTHGQEIIPRQSKIDLEVFYNKMNIFKRLFPVYMTVGLILLGIFLLQLFKPSLEFRMIIRIFLVILGIAFVAHTIGLGIRWYISGHAPWSNGYESMIYIAWATMLAGFIFLKKSAMTLSVTSILAGITLLTAHMSWMNPEITNLVPVLKSYWLTLHVSTITASYGFLGLGSMLGFLNLSIMIFRTRKNQVRVNLTLQELTYIIEMSLMVGLILLVIGNFLGGIWANESWGRYWGWDPKETWSLVTIIVYSFILHMRLIPGMKSLFSTNFGALIGFGSVLMTYFGVNYYLSGLHSYAQGDPVPVPDFVYYVVFFILLVSVLAGINDARMKKHAATT